MTTQIDYLLHQRYPNVYVSHETCSDRCWCGAEFIARCPSGTFQVLVAERESREGPVPSVIHLLPEGSA